MIYNKIYQIQIIRYAISHSFHKPSKLYNIFCGEWGIRTHHRRINSPLLYAMRANSPILDKKYIKFFVAHSGIEPLFREWKSRVLTDRRMGQRTYDFNSFHFYLQLIIWTCTCGVCSTSSINYIEIARFKMSVGFYDQESLHPERLT